MSKVNTTTLSLPKSKTVRGYEIRRLPLGGYLLAIESLQKLPQDIIALCLPGDDLEQALKKLQGINKATLQSMIGSLLVTAPAHVIGLCAALTGIEESALLEDLNIGADGLIELLEAVIEVNNLDDFFTAARRMAGKLRAMAGNSRRPTTGSNG